MSYDVAIVGAGPAGLHAALKAAILNHTVLLVDKGPRFSRISQARAVANIPGRPGVSGEALLAQGREDLRRFQDGTGKRLVEIAEGTEVMALARRADGGFDLTLREDVRERVEHAAVVILATGMVDRKPGIAAFDERGHQTLSPFVRKGAVGYCLLCEGWSLEGKEVAVLGSGDEAAAIAQDVAEQFGGAPTLLTDGVPRAGGAPVDARPIERLDATGDAFVVRFEDGTTRAFDKAILSLGIHRVHSKLAKMAGASTTPEGFVVTDGNCEALDPEGDRVEGLFAIGDVRAHQWKQVVIAWGDAETAVLAAYAHRLPTAWALRGATNPPEAPRAGGATPQA